VIAITIARDFSDGTANLRRIGELMEELTVTFRALGFGKARPGAGRHLLGHTAGAGFGPYL
jgi:hypothetical protein